MTKDEALEKKAENARELGLDYEPVACKECHLKDMVYDLLGDLKVANLKLSVRAKRTWVGLTEQEQGAMMEDLNAYGTNLYQFARAIEAKLKEKNNG